MKSRDKWAVEGGQKANAVGHAAEQAALCCYETGGQPPWVINLRQATSEEEGQGIDLVAELDVGIAYVQVKSSKRGAEKHTAKSSVPVLIVFRDDGDRRIRFKLTEILKAEREKLAPGSTKAQDHHPGPSDSVSE